MRVLVTGANGFIGGAVVKALIETGHEVLATGRGPDFKMQTPYIAKHLDTNTDWSDVLVGVTQVVHTAARVHVFRETSSNPLDEFLRINCYATLNLAKQAADAGVKRFVFISTIGVNGNQTFSKPFTENDAAHPHNNYAISKHEAENGLLDIARNTSMQIVIIRPPLVYGPDVKGNFANLLRWVHRGVPLPFGSIKNKRSLVALDNLISFIIICLHHPKASNEIFLISDGEDINTNELVRRLAFALGKKPRLIYVPVKWMQWLANLLGKTHLAESLFGSLQINNSKATQILEWQPTVSMEQQLNKCVNRQ